MAAYKFLVEAGIILFTTKSRVVHGLIETSTQRIPWAVCLKVKVAGA
jgi:hypothetical protein